MIQQLNAKVDHGEVDGKLTSANWKTWGRIMRLDGMDGGVDGLGDVVGGMVLFADRDMDGGHGLMFV